MANFPTSVSTDANLYVAVNGVQTTLASPALSTDVILTLTSTTFFPATGAITVDNNEVVFYTGVSGNTLTGCVRGADGTTALAHSTGAVVGLTIVAAHHNLLKDEIEAIETALGAGYTKTLENLSDVSITSPLSGQLLSWNGTDWVNITSAANGLTQLTGDVTTPGGPGVVAATLATVNSNVGSFTNTSITVNAKGLITAAASGGPATVWGPIGSSFLYSSSTPPNANYVVKNGQAISRTTYATLFSLIGTTFGVGDGSDTFNIPNNTDRFPMGAGGLYTLGQTGGASTHTLTSGEVPTGSYVANSTSVVTDPTHNHEDYCTGPAGQLTNGGSGQNTMGRTTLGSLNNQASSTGITVATTTTVSDSNGGGSHSILNPFLSEYWMYRIQ